MAQLTNPIQNFFFIGIAGTGMSAIAQYLKAAGHQVSGSDRQFQKDIFNESRAALEAEGINCYEQGGIGVTEDIDIVVVSTAIEESVPEVQQARVLGKPIKKRSEILAEIVSQKKTIAIGGTSGKSTTTAMLFEILSHAGLHPSVIGGAGLTRLIKKGKIGNAAFGEGEWLVIEADESDGSIVQYHPAIGVLLNVDKDHQDLDALMELFKTFRTHSEKFIVNKSHPLAASLSSNDAHDFDVEADAITSIHASAFKQEGSSIQFKVDQTDFSINSPGKHNMENALAAIAVAHAIGVDFQTSSVALKGYEGIYRRHQVLGEKKGITVIDDFAHNPVKCARSIEACQPFSEKLIAWFQPHGYGPTRFLRHDFVEEIAKVLRPQDEIWMSEIYYAGGTAVKDISANDLINDLKNRGVNAYFVEDRNQLIAAMRPHFTPSTTLLLMGARDPSLGSFAQSVFELI
ncbi:MAG: UDP-N-acetylmuramate--L-alanine ligase [Chitinophagaceae bacterium]